MFENLKRMWSKFPDRASAEMPTYYGRSPRLDPVRAIAEHCALSELKLYKKTEYRKNGKNADPIAEHPFYDLLENPVPNFPEFDAYTLKLFTFAQMELVGECAWLKIRSGKKITGLIPVMKSWIKEKPTTSSNYYLIQPYGEVNTILRVPPEDVVLFKDIDMSDPFGNGKGLAESIADEIEADEYASKYQKNFFYNDATPPFVITGFQGGEQQAEKVKQTFMQKMAGFLHAKEPAVLTGSADVKTIGLAPRELDMVESRKFLRDECLQHFRLPPEVMGIIENSNRSTIDASFYLMQKNVMLPRLARFEKVVTRQLLADFDKDLMCRFDFEIEEDVAQKLQIYTVGLQNASVTREEFRKAFGFEAEIKEGSLLMPFSVSIVDAGTEIELPEEENGNGSESPNSSDGKNIALERIKKKDKREELKIKAWNVFDKKAKSGEQAFINAVKKLSDHQIKDINGLILDYDTQKPIENLINDYFTKDVDAKVKSTLAPAWLNSLKGGMENAQMLLGKKSESIDITFLINENFNKWIEKYGLEKSVLINDTTKKELVKKLKAILAEEDSTQISVHELKKRLMEGAKEVGDNLTRTRALMIARTETGSSVNYGQMETYKEYGVEKKEWVATYDDRTRDTHLFADGNIVNINESFNVDGENLMYPLDPNGSVGNIINCRCTCIAVTD